ncbi:MAG: coproporphyrinogen dehydrogenase HemZ [Epulopiscium sp.]|nr:coproporphyrinogen dehydrogenase HemZ [Candidatus Epulonipiscium sp.]
MIQVTLVGHEFQYEIEHLLRAFFPQARFNFSTVTSADQDMQVISMWKDDRFYAKVEVEDQTYVKEHKEHITITKEMDRRKIAKRLLKKVLYEALVAYTKKPLPWGILTGIRPTKIVQEALEEGRSEKDITKELLETFHIQQDKIDLMLAVAKAEKQILDKNKVGEISIYIGIPFCPTRCVYCSFTSYPILQWKDQVDKYIDALIKEIKAFHDFYEQTPIRSVYIGGGTPTSLDETQLQRLLDAVNMYIPMESVEEWTIEAGRPDTITLEKLQMMKEAGVGRISINPQTMQNKTLEVIGRQHTVDDIIQAFYMAKEVGFHCINMDLIVGLPGENIDDVKETWNQLSLLKPDNITIHTMAIKRASYLHRNQEKYHMMDTNEVEEILAFIEEQAKFMGLEPYYLYRQKNMVGNFENVGYALLGKECIYNVEIMEEKQTILAFGAGAATKIVDLSTNAIQRIENVKDVQHYIERTEEMIQRKNSVKNRIFQVNRKN